MIYKILYRFEIGSQLRHILSDTESYHVELTTLTDNMDKFCQAICAFSNDVSGSGKNGYLIIGAYDDGISGLKVDDRLLLQIANMGYVNRFSRGVYRVQKELEENGNGKAIFDFSLVTAFRVVEKVSEKYFEEGFGIDTTQENEETAQKLPETTRNRLLQIIKRFYFLFQIDANYFLCYMV